MRSDRIVFIYVALDKIITLHTLATSFARKGAYLSPDLISTTECIFMLMLIVIIDFFSQSSDYNSFLIRKIHMQEK